MSSKSSLISILDLKNIKTEVWRVESRRALVVEITATYENQEWVRRIEIAEKTTFRDFTSWQDRERLIQCQIGVCLEQLCVDIQRKVGPFRMALRKAVKIVEEGHYVPELTEK